VDNFSTGRRENIAHLDRNQHFKLIEADVVDGIPVDGAIDAVLHFASPASPPRYLELPIETLRVGSEGTRNALELARMNGARFLVASTSEVYGDPSIHPQPETYWGNVNPIGVRSVYDEAKRFGEAMTAAYRRTFNVDAKIVRIFNTYGPRLDPGDGRVVSNLLTQAIAGEPLTVYGDGSQTRSFCYVEDEVRGLLALLDSEEAGPINIGNPIEMTMLELVELVREVTGSTSEMVHRPLPQDDPKQRKPDITLAKERLGWEPRIDPREGLQRTAEWYRQ
ncbi:MAG: NAD-dependent epimerase/dehydratase family protein, partial [Acidimicrobiia bacterium]